MIKLLLVAGLLVPWLPTRSGSGLRPAFVILAASSAASGDGDGWKAEALAALDLKTDDDGCDSECSVTATIDRAALLAELPTLQEHGALSKDITANDVAKQPAFYANAFSLLLTSYAVHHLYASRPELGRTRWKVLLSAPAASDDRNAREVYSFAFDRPLYESTAWDRVPFTEFPKAAAKFRYNLRFKLDLSREVSGSIDDD